MDKKETAVERLYFDAYQIAELYTIFDRYKEKERMYDKWLLWAFVQKCFPKYTLADYKWDLNFSNPLIPFIWLLRRPNNDTDK